MGLVASFLNAAGLLFQPLTASLFLLAIHFGAGFFQSEVVRGGLFGRQSEAFLPGFARSFSGFAAFAKDLLERPEEHQLQVEMHQDEENNGGDRF